MRLYIYIVCCLSVCVVIFSFCLTKTFDHRKFCTYEQANVIYKHRFLHCFIFDVITLPLSSPAPSLLVWPAPIWQQRSLRWSQASGEPEMQGSNIYEKRKRRKQLIIGFNVVIALQEHNWVVVVIVSVITSWNKVFLKKSKIILKKKVFWSPFKDEMMINVFCFFWTFSVVQKPFGRKVNHKTKDSVTKWVERKVQYIVEKEDQDISIIGLGHDVSRIAFWNFKVIVWHLRKYASLIE